VEINKNFDGPNQNYGRLRDVEEEDFEDTNDFGNFKGFG
jgi:hypothetical protein